MGDSRQSVQVLQSQLDEFRDRSRRELQDTQRLSKDRLIELQRAQALLKTTQEEVRQTVSLDTQCKNTTLVFIIKKSTIIAKIVTSFIRINTKSSNCPHPSAQGPLTSIVINF